MSEEADLLHESNVVAPSPFQQRVLALPEHWNLLLAGGRGGSKSVCSQFLMIRHAMKYRERAKILYVRESWESIKQFEDELAQLIQKVFGKEVGHHSTNHMFTWQHGGTIQLSQLEDEKDYTKFQGKLLCDETPIPTPDGWKILKDIQVGDKVFDEKGVPCNVVDVHQALPEKTYRLTFKDGCTIDCCSEHQWCTLTFADRRACDQRAGGNFPEDWANRPAVTTQAIVDTFRHRGKDYNHSVPLALPLDLPAKDLGIDPYLFGLWLGDGTSVRSDITTMDPEIVSAFEAQGFALEVRKTNSPSKAKCYKIGPNVDAPTGPRTKFGQQLYSLGVFGKDRKHIPSKFLRASREQRLALLQGLMDTDGYVNCTCSSVEFSNSNPLIVKAFVELARSLGERPVITHGIGECNGKKTKPKFRVRWTPNLVCFRLSRKAARLRLRLNPKGPGYKYIRRQRTITAYEEIAPKPMRCLMVDSPNHMYLCGEGMIPTHNSFTMLVVDEYGARRDTKYVWLLASNMRAPRGIPTQIILLANPGGQQHGHLHYDFIAQGPAWQPFDKAGEPWIHAPSTWRDNPHIDQAAYVRKLRQACGNDEELFKAWDSGDWNIARGAYFAGALDEKVHMLSIPQEESDPRIIAPECPYPLTREWQPFIAQDWGSGAPCITTVFGESPGVPGFPKGSLIAVDELALHEVNDLNVGLNWSPDKLAEGVKDLCKPWRVFPSGVGDDAYGLEDTLLNTLRKLGIYLRRPKKERVAGWQLMRNMLVSVKNRDGGPGLWISARCQYFWRTVPFLSRDPKRPEDILTKNVPDHSGDCIRYGIQSRGHRVTSGSVTGI